MKPPPFQNLAKRLNDICQWEKLTTDLRAMLALCEISDGDIRASLNTLQFLSKRDKTVTLQQLVDTSIGAKDIGKDWMYICNQIFHLPNAKQQKVYSQQKNLEDTVLNHGNYVNRLGTLIQSNGEYDKIMIGDPNWFNCRLL